MSEHRKSNPSPGAASVRKRIAYFVIGAVIGGVLGYGIVTTSPGPALSIFDPAAAAWIFGGAAVCGFLGALSPNTFWRRRHESTRDRDG